MYFYFLFCFVVVVVLVFVFTFFFHDDQKIRGLFNSFTPKSYYRLITPYNFALESNMKVLRIKEMITNLRNS